MNKNTLQSVEMLLRNVEEMKASFNEFNRERAEAPKREKFLEFCASMGAVEGQATIVRIDFDIYEKPPQVLKGLDLVSELTAQVEQAEKISQAPTPEEVAQKLRLEQNAGMGQPATERKVSPYRPDLNLYLDNALRCNEQGPESEE